jgi:T5SS/PEP-CTERM-associated repeat protein
MTNVTINGNQGYNATVNINGFLGIGTGSLDIGGTVTVSEAAYIGYGTPSDGKVTVTSSTGIWNIGTELFIGYQGPGVLTLGNGGTVSVTGGTGRVTISEQGTLNIGAALTAPMTLDPGTLSASKILFSLDSDPNTPAGTGALNFNHAGTAYTSAEILEGQGTITHAAGTTTLTGSSPLFAGAVKVQDGMLLVNGQIGTAANNTLAVTVEGGGRLGGTGTVGGSVNVKAGGLLVGPTNETLDLGSLVLNTDSGVSVTLGAPGSAAPFHIGGDLTLGGTLQVTGTNGFD